MLKEAYRLVIEYLKSNGAIVTESANKAAVQLSEQLDRKFMNRPFYWHYRDALNQSGDPLQIMLVDSPDTSNHKGFTQLNYDHPIFQSMLASAQEENRFYTAYEKAENQRDLFPWIHLQLTTGIIPPGPASIRIDSRISLTTGLILMNSHEKIPDLHLFETRPNGSVLHSNRIPYETALNILNTRFEKYCEQLLEENSEQHAAVLQKNKPDPSISIHHISAGLIYLCSP
ncbi:YqhG family protein [Jeotgalibacillus salarius]|nr:YqhG family protein [Jeotgalibacillus salarius]